ncbi:MAG: DnaJ family molecular chaperone [Bauldia sp.]|nr:DnaJ family molecular chaperone [Bauldia sp.]
MSIWQRFRQVLGDGVVAVGAVFDRIGTIFAGDPEERRHMAFSVAMVALSAKMAKADGVVTLDEVRAFRRLVDVPPSQAQHVERLFAMARRDVAGFESYAKKIASLYEPHDPILADLMDGLFDIASADTVIHDAEIDFLAEVARRLGFSDEEFERIKLRHVVPEDGDPYLVLGVARTLGYAELRAHYRRLVAEHHPDRLIAHGVPAEFIAIANHKLAAINVAWDRIERERKPAAEG